MGFRKINEGYAESTGHFEQKVEHISLCGMDIDTDKAIARAKNTIADARAIQQTMSLKSMAYSFNDKFINGDPQTDPEEYKGLLKRVDDVNAEGFTTQLIDVVVPDILPGTTANNHAFLNKLDELIYSIKGHKPDFLFMNKKMLLVTRAILRLERLLDNTRDMFDRVIDVYQGCRMIDIGTKADQTTEIITYAETKGGGTGETSIYAARFGIGEYLWGIQEYPLEVVDIGELESKPVYRTRVDWPLGLAITDSRSVARLYGIKVA